MARSLTQITDLTADEVRRIFDLCARMKSGQIAPKPLAGKAVACIFTKPSLRTRISFEVGINQLGGHALYITDNEIKLGERETIQDAARVLSRYIGMIMIRTFKQSDVEGLAKYASVPVVNGLTDLVHPCQILGDYFTVMESFPGRERFKIAYVGDGNNIVNSWLNLASLIPMDLRIGTAADTQPDGAILRRAQANPASRVLLTEDPKEAVAGADVVYTDVWASMGQKHLAEQKAEKLKKYQLNSSLLALADPKAIVLHCLPAERGREITDEVIDGPHSRVFDEAENRLHIQKAIMTFLLQ
ncbi:MAG TPA: ornithine carbamoyltransferase [candidate division Zixibacteria bacterium]|nr:ornithine carbamoyltransferase [candidate division Zixibacteria bacterium]MDD4917080.1 ornithine carbamoyltransferase [candidate division Zixibacteria bacterium]MDM7972938.1 ornithine carbamoyltransferase [candidate division Zixibacteria bacterium]HOD65306.1 ornithine carbamoyltransferase [candidate division Zixibacteria bacterium]HOZ08566.1 ornithine carbamoyltransferase [candidate division Zixibacteria bacterium]